MNVYLALFALLVFVLIMTPVFLKRSSLAERAMLHELKVVCDYVAFTGESIQTDIKITPITDGNELRYKQFKEVCVSQVDLVSGILRVKRVGDYLGD